MKFEITVPVHYSFGSILHLALNFFGLNILIGLYCAKTVIVKSVYIEVTRDLDIAIEENTIWY